MSKKVTLITKRDALRMVTKDINRPGIINLNTFMELLTWQSKLTLWVLQDSAKGK